MSANKILERQAIKTILKGGVRLSLEYATKTDTWKRVYLNQNVQDGFAQAKEKADVPKQAAKAILAYVVPLKQ